VLEDQTSVELDLTLPGTDKLFTLRAFSPGPGQVATLVEDITERKQFENNLRRQLIFTESLLDAISDPVFFKDKEGRYLGCNKAYEEFRGITRQELCGKSVFDVTTREKAELHHAQDMNLMRDCNVSGIAHITGGGLLENIPRVLPNGCKAVVRKDSWQIPEIFQIIQRGGNIDETEMFRTFNCGIGMVIAVPEREADDIMIRLSGLNETAYHIGEVVKCEAGKECVELV
jgi:PAS domain-containing protein